MEFTPSTFDFAKTLQAACLILRHKQCEPVGFKRLVKLLYIADRESLSEKGRPISGDRYSAMDHGPVLSELYDIMKDGEGERSAKWRQFVGGSKFRLKQAADPGTGHLSRYEVRKLTEVLEKYANHDIDEIVRMTHGFGEYVRNKPQARSSKPIPLEHVLEALNMTPDDIASVKAMNEERNSLRGAFRSHSPR